MFIKYAHIIDKIGPIITFRCTEWFHLKEYTMAKQIALIWSDLYL